MNMLEMNLIVSFAVRPCTGEAARTVRAGIIDMEMAPSAVGAVPR